MVRQMESKRWDHQILDKLISRGLIGEQDAALVLSEQKDGQRTAIEVIEERKLVDPQTFIAFLSGEFHCPPVNPNLFRIPEEIIQIVPAQYAIEKRVLPISIHENALTVAMENPNDLSVIDDLKAMTNMRIRPAVTFPLELKLSLQKYYHHGETQEVPQSSEETIEELIRIVQEQKQDEAEIKTVDLLRQAQETPVIKVANALLVDGIRRRASDLFIEPWERAVRVRCRVDGLLEEVKSAPKSISSALVSRFKVMSHLDIAERRIPQDGRFKIKVQNREVDVRVSILPTSHGEKVCLRILDKKAQSYSIDKLGFTSRELSILKTSVLKPHGMILVTGPTGSGKTTTLYSVLKFLDSPQKNITTVEDPVEYQVDGINQVNVREAIGLTFPGALRSILRQDPDIILIGEIRDLNTMDIAIKAALTGHLVLSTLHTNDTSSAIVRMINMGIEPFLITSSLIMISAQRLIRKLCNACKSEMVPEKGLIEKLNLEPGRKYTFYKAVGCEKCRSMGYSGRSVITEILQMTPEVKELIMKKGNAEEIKTLARQQGMTTLRQSGVQKAIAGETTLDEVFRVTAGDQEIEVG